MDYVYLKYKAGCAFSPGLTLRIAEPDCMLGILAPDGPVDCSLVKYR